MSQRLAVLFVCAAALIAVCLVQNQETSLLKSRQKITHWGINPLSSRDNNCNDQCKQNKNFVCGHVQKVCCQSPMHCLRTSNSFASSQFCIEIVDLSVQSGWFSKSNEVCSKRMSRPIPEGAFPRPSVNPPPGFNPGKDGGHTNQPRSPAGGYAPNQGDPQGNTGGQGSPVGSDPYSGGQNDFGAQGGNTGGSNSGQGGLGGLLGGLTGGSSSGQGGLGGLLGGLTGGSNSGQGGLGGLLGGLTGGSSSGQGGLGGLLGGLTGGSGSGSTGGISSLFGNKQMTPEGEN